jgi:hypothetical protein
MKKAEQTMFDVYLQHLMQRALIIGDKSSANTYHRLISQIRSCVGNQSVSVKEIDGFFILKLRQKMVYNGLAENTAKKYIYTMRIAYYDFLLTNRILCGFDPFLEANRMRRKGEYVEL